MIINPIISIISVGRNGDHAGRAMACVLAFFDAVFFALYAPSFYTSGISASCPSGLNLSLESLLCALGVHKF